MDCSDDITTSDRLRCRILCLLEARYKPDRKQLSWHIASIQSIHTDRIVKELQQSALKALKAIKLPVEVLELPTGSIVLDVKRFGKKSKRLFFRHGTMADVHLPEGPASLTQFVATMLSHRSSICEDICQTWINQGTQILPAQPSSSNANHTLSSAPVNAIPTAADYVGDDFEPSMDVVDGLPPPSPPDFEPSNVPLVGLRFVSTDAAFALFKSRRVAVANPVA
eukprot:m.293886 g.293886  ORF g.293886 m.293886 type:complete len:224 (-) comp34385_c0_seq1:100-771(-)